ncbi:MAG TPA: DUF362 domain-containing protein [Polyangiaceae bacterium]|nr:DUF362 domain-containing protein [Polyangiaceae bacterium]
MKDSNWLWAGCAIALAVLQGCGSSEPPQSGGSAGSNASVGGPGGANAAGAAGADAGTSGGGIAGNAAGGIAGNSASPYLVAMLQSSLQRATELSTSDVADLVGRAVSQAGGLDFIHDGQTVVLKLNLPTVYQDNGETLASPTVSGINTDWRVTKAVADLVRGKNPTGKVLVMEGSTFATTIAYAALGYTTANFGSSVNEFIALEGESCTEASTAALEQRPGPSGKQYWVDRRYLAADVVISIPTLATDAWAGIGGAVESLGIGATPAGQYSSGENPNDCARTKIDRATAETTGAFISDYYSIKPADFVVVDGLQGLEHGPLPVLDQSNYDYASSIKNMRLILAGKNAVAVDTTLALVMKCDPKKVPHLTKLEANGRGTTDAAKITVVGTQVSEVAQPFASRQQEICPGK